MKNNENLLKLMKIKINENQSKSMKIYENQNPFTRRVRVHGCDTSPPLAASAGGERGAGSVERVAGSGGRQGRLPRDAAAGGGGSRGRRPWALGLARGGRAAWRGVGGGRHLRAAAASASRGMRQRAVRRGRHGCGWLDMGRGEL